MNNTLVYGLFFGMILAPAFICLQLMIFSSLVTTLKLDKKLKKPTRVLALIISEVVAVLFSIKSIFSATFYYPVIIVGLLLIEIYGLWQMKKWVIYVYLLFAIVTQVNYFLSGVISDYKLLIISIISQILVLLVYYFYVYKPSEKQFK